jgi:hypothetical protein
MKMNRLSLEIDRETYDYFSKMAREKRTDIGGVIEQGLKILRTAREQRKMGRSHLGFVSDPTKLDVELIII